MDETPSQFTRRILGLDYQSEPTDEPLCWLCAGQIGGQGVPIKAVIGAAFTDHPKKHNSTHVCVGCAATLKVAEFQRVVTERQMDLKLWSVCGFNNYGHFVAEPDIYECPKPARFREILLDPPAGKWLVAINETGKKHTIAKTVVNVGRKTFGVVCADELIWTTRERFTEALADFERMSELDFSKDEIASGQLRSENVLRARSDGREAELRMRRWRREDPHLVLLLHYCARSRVFYNELRKAAAA